jgi:glutathione S-transferase
VGIITPTNKDVTALEGLHLYHAGQSNCSMRVRMVLEEKGLDWTSHHIDLRKAENVTPEYFGIHPKGLVPTLVHDGVVIIESTDIINYLEKRFPEPPLQPADEASRQQMQEWLDLATNNHLHVKAFMFANQLGKRMAKTQAELEAYRKLQDNEELLEFHMENSSAEGLSEERVATATRVLNDCFGKIEQSLAEHAWLVGDTFSLADITWIPLYVTLNNAEFPFDRYPRVLRWKDAVQTRPSYQKAVVDWMPKELLRA